jgi:serine protease inhibitor
VLRYLRYTVLGSVIALVAACGDPAGPEGAGSTIQELPRPLSPSEVVIIDRSNAFGIDLIREVLEIDDRPNVVLSPLSASMALGMTLNGAAGTTFDGMREALRFGGLSRAEINASYRDLTTLLTDLDPEVEVSIANSAWANEGYTFHSAFFDAVVEHFDATAESRDFADPATLTEINRWVDEGTRGRIDRILEEGELDPALALLLLNAVYFEGRWTTEFDPRDTETRSFTRADGSTVDVEMMSLSGVELPFGGAGGLTAAELPYGGGAYSMVVAVPGTATPAREILSAMDRDDWTELLDSLEPLELDALSLPRFRLAYDAFLNGPLTDMGMGVAFTQMADFSDLSPDGLCIDFARQKTFVEVDEVGTRAAAITGVGIGPTSFVGLIVDRPFLFAIRERLSGTILFVGLIGDPSQEDSGPAEFPEPCRHR